jgi:hypothetical protein
MRLCIFEFYADPWGAERGEIGERSWGGIGERNWGGIGERSWGGIGERSWGKIGAGNDER